MSWYIEEQEPVYLDYNATTPLDSTVKKAIAEGLELWANPSSKTPLGEDAPHTASGVVPHENAALFKH